MKTRGKAIRAAAFIAAAALTAGALLPYQNAGFTVSRLTAYADETKTEGKEGPFSYFKYSDRVEIISCDMSVTSVEIPTTIEGLPVTAIDMYAFECSKLKTITIPESIERIGYWSFAMFSELESVYLPDSLKLIEMHAFEACPKLETIVFPDHLVEVHSKAFEDTPWLAAQRAKDKVVIVNGTVVDARTAEGDIVLPSDVKFISSSAFANNDKVTSVVVPAGVSVIKDDTFWDCPNLVSLEIQGAETLEYQAISKCPKLTDLKLSGKLTSIDHYAFDGNTSQATITFYGSQSDWESVTKPENDPFLSNAKFVFEEYHVSPPPSLRGDVNSDNAFNVSDIVLVSKWLLGDPSAELQNWRAADFIGDGVLDTYDLCVMRAEIVKQ